MKKIRSLLQSYIFKQSIQVLYVLVADTAALGNGGATAAAIWLALTIAKHPKNQLIGKLTNILNKIRTKRTD